MELFYFSILLFAITSSNAFERIKGIDGSVTDLEFDYNCNVYGVENIPKFKHYKWIFPFFINSIYEWKSFLFKLGPDQKLAWKIQFSDEVVGRLGVDSIFHKTRILINHQNDVYLVVEKKESAEILTLMMNDNVPILRKIWKYSSPTSISEAFIVDDNIIILQDEKMSSRSTIKILKINSGKWLTIASDERNSLHITKDKEDNIYFNKNDDSGTQQLFIFTKDSLEEDNLTPRLISNVINDKENVANLKIGHRNELYIELYDNSTSFVKIKKFAGNTTKTIFERSGQDINDFRQDIKLTPMTMGVYIKYFKEKHHMYGGHIGAMTLTFESVYVNEDDKTVSLSLNTSHTLPRNVTRNVAWKRKATLNTDKALTDKEGNLYFEHYVPNDLNHYVHYLNHSSGEIVEIEFVPSLSVRFVKEKDMLFDEDENVLIFVRQERLGSPSYLYFLKKGALTAEEIFSHEDMIKIRKSREDNVYLTSHTGLFLKASSNKKMNRNNFLVIFTAN